MQSSDESRSLSITRLYDFPFDAVELCRTLALRSLNVNGPLKLDRPQIGKASMARTAGKARRGKRPNTAHEYLCMTFRVQYIFCAFRGLWLARELP